MLTGGNIGREPMGLPGATTAAAATRGNSWEGPLKGGDNGPRGGLCCPTVARPCTVCRHPESVLIDDELFRGTPRLTVAKHYGLKEPAVRNHAKRHIMLPPSRAELTAKVRQRIALVETVFAQAEGSGDVRTALSAARELRSWYELEKSLTYRERDAQVPETRGFAAGNRAKPRSGCRDGYVTISEEQAQELIRNRHGAAIHWGED